VLIGEFSSIFNSSAHSARRRGAKPNIHQDAAGGLIRSIVLSLDELKITEKCGKGGRKVTSVGQRALDQVARHVALGEA
jgi:ribosomal protein S19E (S16A)